ncbi:PRC-barrel domain containing protein, partial [Streptomyces sp. NPDC090054]
VDAKEEKILVNLTKDQIKDSPEYDKDKHRGDAAYRDQIGTYYQGRP